MAARQTNRPNNRPRRFRDAPFPNTPSRGLRQSEFPRRPAGYFGGGAQGMLQRTAYQGLRQLSRQTEQERLRQAVRNQATQLSRRMKPGRVYAGGSANFDESTGRYRNGSRPPRFTNLGPPPRGGTPVGTRPPRFTNLGSPPRGGTAVRPATLRNRAVTRARRRQM